MCCCFLGRISRSNRRCAVLILFCLYYAAIFVLEGDEVLVKSCSKRRLVCCSTGHGYNRVVPTIERIGVLCCCFLGRIGRGYRRCAILILFCLDNAAIFVLERDEVLVQSRCELCHVGCSTGYSYNRVVPTVERIGVLCCGVLSRISRSYRRCAVFVLFSLNNAAIFVLERDEVLVQSRSERRLVGCSTGYGYNRVVPTVERIGVLCRGILGRISRSNRCCTVLILFCLDRAAIFVLEGDEVLVQCRSERCLVGCLARNGYNRIIPTVERVGVLCRSFLGRISRSNRRCAILILLGFDYAAIFVLEGDEVLVQSCSERCLVGCSTGYGNNRVIPTTEGICILCRSFLGRISRSNRR